MHVVVLDDEADIAELIARILRLRGHTTVVFTNSFDAIDYFRFHDAEAIVTDYWMPYLDGIRVLEAVRALAPEVRRVMLTAASYETAITTARQVGTIQALVSKPPVLADLLAALL